VDAAGTVFARPTGVFFNEVYALDDQPILLGDDPQDLAGLAEVLSGDDLYGIAFPQADTRPVFYAVKFRGCHRL
jgi:hypothetical protein